MAEERELAPRQALFIQEYIKDLNGTQAAIRAGYSPDTAQEQSSRLLSNAIVSEALKDAQGIVAERNGIDQDWIVNNLRTVAERCMQQEPVMDKTGQPTGEYVFNATGANKALELLGKTLAMFVEKSESTVTHVSHEDALALLEKAAGYGARAETSH